MGKALAAQPDGPELILETNVRWKTDSSTLGGRRGEDRRKGEERGGEEKRRGGEERVREGEGWGGVGDRSPCCYFII